MISWKKEKDIFVLDIIGFRLEGTRISKYPLLFSERNGLVNLIICNGWAVRIDKIPRMKLGIIKHPPTLFILDKLFWFLNSHYSPINWRIMGWILKHTPPDEGETK